MNIYLIGMPGCGKSSVGMTLSNEIGYIYVDLDKYIEEKNNMSIPKIFEAFGEKKFRELEREALIDFSYHDSYVISCGGGIINNKANKELMNGKVVYINVSLDILKDRIENDKANIRPMFKTKTIEELWNERKDKYEYFKDVEVLNININDAVSDIKKELGL